MKISFVKCKKSMNVCSMFRSFGRNMTKAVFNKQFMMTVAVMLFGCGFVMAQNSAGDYSAGTTALATVTEENAFWLNHTHSKYDIMNIRLKKTRYK